MSVSPNKDGQRFSISGRGAEQRVSRWFLPWSGNGEDALDPPGGGTMDESSNMHLDVQDSQVKTRRRPIAASFSDAQQAVLELGRAVPCDAPCGAALLRFTDSGEPRP